MGLDAVVYCDCFEKGRLKEPPPSGCRLEIDRDGSMLCGSDALDVQMAFDQWRLHRACNHDDGVLVHHRIGNVALVAALRAELERFPGQFPLILSKVVYNGTHCGDFIADQDVQRLRSEVEALADVRYNNPDMEELIREFKSQMSDLVESALRIGKPISF
jgi:hypothetical protein